MERLVHMCSGPRGILTLHLSWSHARVFHKVLLRNLWCLKGLLTFILVCNVVFVDEIQSFMVALHSISLHSLRSIKEQFSSVYTLDLFEGFYQLPYGNVDTITSLSWFAHHVFIKRSPFTFFMFSWGFAACWTYSQVRRETPSKHYVKE